MISDLQQANCALQEKELDLNARLLVAAQEIHNQEERVRALSLGAALVACRSCDAVCLRHRVSPWLFSALCASWLATGGRAGV